MPMSRHYKTNHEHLTLKVSIGYKEIVKKTNEVILCPYLKNEGIKSKTMPLHFKELFVCSFLETHSFVIKVRIFHCSCNIRSPSAFISRIEFIVSVIFLSFIHKLPVFSYSFRVCLYSTYFIVVGCF